MVPYIVARKPDSLRSCQPGGTSAFKILVKHVDRNKRALELMATGDMWVFLQMTGGVIEVIGIMYPSLSISG